MSLLRLATINDFSVNDIETILKNISESQKTQKQYTHLEESPLMTAVLRPDVLALLLKSKMWDANAQNWFGKTALMYAVQYNNAESVKLLLANQADPNLATFKPEDLKDEDCGINNLRTGNRTALMYAAWYGTPEMMGLLIHAGAKPENRDDESDDSPGKKAVDYLSLNTSLLPVATKEAKELLRTH